MVLSRSTTSLLAHLDALSGGKLTRKEDIGVLMEVASRAGVFSLLEKLSFRAKFVHRTYGIMKRIGPDANGYDKLDREFRENLDLTRTLLLEVLEHGPADERARFDETYLAVTPAAVQSLLALAYDLGWYKNMLLDRHGGAR